MEKPILYCDCDGVIFNTIDVAYDFMIKSGVDLKDRKKVDLFFRKVVDWHYVFNNAKPINDAINKLNILKDSGLFSNIKILTALSGNYEEEGIKRKLFSTLTPGIDVITLQYGLKKGAVVPNPHANILVDDEPRYCSNWNSYCEDDTAILFSQESSDVDNNVICDLFDIPETSAYKKLIKTRYF